jgi:tetratricopeptide (TPR) repeat protein
MDAALAWTIVGSTAGVVAAVTGVFGVLQVRHGRRNRLVTRTVAAGAVLPAPVGRLPKQVQGRDDLLAVLAGAVKSLDGPVHAIVGLGGCGKSTVALAAAQRAREKGRPVWWVPAIDHGSVTGQLLGLARKLGAPAGEVREALAGQINPSDVLWPRLEAVRGWVLVLDNADDPAVLTAVDRKASDEAGWLRPTRAGVLIVTSRNADAWGPLTVVHRIVSLDDETGGKVLTDLAPGAGDRAEARLLAARLGGLPLALHQAGTYLGSVFSGEQTFAQYQEALEERFGELMARGDDDRVRVIGTWELSLNALTAQGRDQARPLLRVLSCFASAFPVPPILLDLEVLGRTYGGVTAVADGLSGLLTVGLIETRDPADKGDRPPVVVHRLVAETIRYQAGDALQGGFAVAVDLLRTAAGHLNSEDPHDQPAWLALLPHLRALLDREVNTRAEVLAELAEISARFSAALLWGGADPASLDLSEHALERVAALGADHEQILALRFSRASARRYLGQEVEAEHEFREILEARTRILGPDDSSTLATRHELASTLADEGNCAEAEHEFREILEARTRTLGPEDPDTLATWHELATTLGDQGKAAEAEAELRQVLQTRLRVLGPDDPHVLSTRHEIAVVLADQGNYAQAESDYRQVFDAERRVLGPEHPDTLATQHELARMLTVQGNPAGAEAKHRQLLDVRLRIMGPAHPDTLITRHEIAVALADQGKLADAEAEFHQMLVVRQQILGPEHPNTLGTQHHIARVLALQGRLAEADTEYRKVLDARERILGPEHPDTLNTRYQHAATKANLGKTVEAAAEYQQVLEARTRTLGPEHPDTLRTREALQHLRRIDPSTHYPPG